MNFFDVGVGGVGGVFLNVDVVSVGNIGCVVCIGVISVGNVGHVVGVWISRDLSLCWCC